jgi:hypothetical protein
MKKTVLALFVLTVLVSTVVVTQLRGLAMANPYSQAAYSGEMSTVPNTEPPYVSIVSPSRNETYVRNNLLLTLKVSVGNSTAPIGRWTDRGMWLTAIYFEADWIANKTLVYKGQYTSMIADFSITLNLTGIPDGKHHITVTATENDTYYPDFFHYYGFSINASSKVFFTVDTTPPNITLSIQTKTVYPSDVPLSFNLDNSAARTAYSLDGQDNVTIAGNSTLTGLPVGSHNITVYAWDNMGNAGASETITFIIVEPETFPIAQVAIITATSAVVACASVLYFLKKQKR